MAAFLDFLNAYVIWIYIGGAIGVIFGLKMLVDSRRLARATMFTLEQEQAGEKAFRAIVVMLASIMVIAGVSAVNAYLGPARPPSIPPIAKPPTVALTPPIFLPSFTSVPTLTPEAAAPTGTVAPTGVTLQLT